MKKLKMFGLAIAALMAGTVLCSCYYAEISRNQKNLTKIRKGMTKDQVIKIMGEPLKGESYCSDNVFYYYTQQVWMDGLNTRDECTPIAFDEFGRVEGWGKDYNTGIHRVKMMEIRSYHTKKKKIEKSLKDKDDSETP